MTKIKQTHGTTHSLTIGFVLSLLLTFSSYLIATEKLVYAPFLVTTVLALAFLQFLVQVVFFLHLDKEEGPRWNLLAFVSTASIVLLVIVGSAWIMSHLNYNMMPPERIQNYIMHDESIMKK